MDRKQPILKRIALAFFIMLCSSWAWAQNPKTPSTGTNQRSMDPGYCDPYVQFTDGPFLPITLFNMGSITNSSSSNNGYEDFTTLQTNIQKENDISFSIDIINELGHNSQVKMWIDYNHDFDFDDAGEMVYISSIQDLYEHNITINGSFSVPNTDYNGNTRLRIMLYSTYANENPNSCAIDSRILEPIEIGQVEDYTVNIVSPPSITPSVSSLSTFSYVQDSGPSAEQSFTVTGSALSSDISIEAPTNWEVSTTSGSGFANTATLTSSGGIVYTRLKSGLTAASYSGNISLTSGSVTSTPVALSGTVTSPPSITPSLSSLSAFSYVQDSGPSAEQGFAVTGSALSSDISIEAPTNWEVSTTSGSGFANTATLTSSGGIVYTRLKSGLSANSYSGNITLSSGSTTALVSLSGTVNPTPPLLVISGVNNMGATCFPSGDALQQTYTITNTGGSTATISSLVFLHPGFTITNVTDLTITSGGTATITVTFNPMFGYPGANVDNLSLYYDGNAVVYYFVSATLLFPTQATVQTNAADTVGTNSAQLNGDLISLGSCSAATTEQGFVYATTPTPTASNNLYINSSGSLTGGAFSSTLTGLSSGTTYYYRAYAKDANGAYVYGADQSFTTLAVPTWNGTAWNITPDATQPAIINGDYSGPAFESLSLTVNEGKTLTVNNYVKTGNVTNNGNIIVANNANFVQTGTFTAGDNSSFKVRRDSKDVVRQAYINWSSPMKESTQTLKAFSYGKLADGVTNQSTTGTVDNRFYTYSNNNYVQIIDPSRTTFSTLGAGYLIRTPNDFLTPQAFHGQFEGQVPNSGSIRVEHGTIPGNFILLGNPYPSAISLDDFFDLNFYTTYTAYIWQSSAIVDSNGNYSGTNYATYSSAGSVPAGAINGYIPVGQAFFVERMIWVRSQDDTNGYYFTNTMRRTEEKGTYSKGTTTDRFWLQMTTPSGVKPQLLLAFNTAASTGYDQGYDAKMIDNNADVLYTTVDDKKLVIDAHGDFNETDSFSLDANFAQAGTYTINILQKEGIFSGSQKIFLKDNVTGTLTDLSAGAYSFNADAGVQTNRFSIAFTTNRTLGTDGTTKNSLTIFSTGKQVHLKADGKISNVEVYNMSGQLIASDKILAKEKTIAVPYTGVVLVKVQLENGTTSMKKLILQ